MPLTGAEKQKRYREKLKLENPQKYEEMQRKAKERSARSYKKKRNDEKQREELRLKWREARKKAKEGINTSSSQATTNMLNASDQLGFQRNLNRIESKFKRQNARLRSDLGKLLKGFKNLEKKISRQQQKIVELKETYETIIQNIAFPGNKQEVEVNLNINQFTPRKKVHEFIDNTIPDVETPKKDEIKKKLLEYDILTESLKSQFKSSNNVEKNILKKIVTNSIVKKYKLKTKIGANLGIKGYFKMCEQNNKKFELKKKIEEFYNRDDVSRATAGKKEYRTYKKMKRQKRYLLDTLKVLHQKFISEVSNISFSTFKKYRPFHVLFPKVKDRESCACIKHSNMQYMVDELKSQNLLKSNNLNEVITAFVCNFKSKNCMYSICSTCADKELEPDVNVDFNKKASWFLWILKEQEYEKAGEKKKVKKMVKIKKEGTLQELLNTFNSDLKKFKTHIYNFYYQYNQYKICINNLKDNESVIHIDFSENFTCKYHEEIQAMHFIKEQITLHTGVIYLKGPEIISFCSISPVNLHNPEAIWAHLAPVLNYIKSIPTLNINTIHFFSDGPTTQYRQKKNFFLFCKNIYEYDFSHSTWSFFEAAHGKGAADGIGGAIKRTLDLKIAHGVDIPNAKTAFEVLSATETNIKLFYIPAENIKSLDMTLARKLTPLPATMKIHQVVADGKLRLKYRDLSCFCEGLQGNCECHSPISHDFNIIFNDSIKKITGKGLKKKDRKVGKRFKISEISSSSEDTDSIIEYADSDETCCLTNDSMSEDFTEQEENNSMMELDEKTGFFRHKNSEKRITVLSVKNLIAPTNILVNQRAKHFVDKSMTVKRSGNILNEKDGGIQEKNRKFTGTINKENVTTLRQIRHTAENIAYFDLTKTNIFGDKEKKITSNDE